MVGWQGVAAAAVLVVLVARPGDNLFSNLAVALAGRGCWHDLKAAAYPLDRCYRIPTGIAC